MLAAIALQKQAVLNFWDAMVVEAAAESGCDVLWTEDLNDGQLREEFAFAIHLLLQPWSKTDAVNSALYITPRH